VKRHKSYYKSFREYLKEELKSLDIRKDLKNIEISIKNIKLNKKFIGTSLLWLFYFFTTCIGIIGLIILVNISWLYVLLFYIPFFIYMIIFGFYLNYRTNIRE